VPIKMISLPIRYLCLISLALLPFSPSVSAHEFKLSVMNYNIKGLPLPWLKHKGRYERIAKAILTLKDSVGLPDILSLQESIQKRTKAIPLMTKYPFVTKGPEKKFLRSSSGVVTMSKYQIIQKNTLVYDKCASYDCLARKGVLHTRIRVPGMPVDIDLYSTHTQAGPTGDFITPKKLTDKIRDYQVFKMADFVVKTHNPRNILLMVGDFNFRPSANIYFPFSAYLGLENSAYNCGVWQDCQGATDTYSLWENLIDHQFYRAPDSGDIQIRPVYFNKFFDDPTGGKVYSDHKAVLVQYEIKW